MKCPLFIRLATGGSLPGLVPQLPAAQLNLTHSIGNTGNMYEKFSILNIDSAGGGGEYTVQVSIVPVAVFVCKSLMIYPLVGWFWMDQRSSIMGCEQLWQRSQ